MPDEMAMYERRVSMAVRTLNGKWTIHILCYMREGPVRLSQLTRNIPAASKKALTANLRSLEAAQIVVRRDLSKTVLHVEYDLAEGVRASLESLLDHLRDWADAYQVLRRSTEPQ